MPSLIEGTHGGRETDILNEAINKTRKMKPSTLVFGVLSGIIVGSLLWYFGLT
jgi:hypothetical protein